MARPWCTEELKTSDRITPAISIHNIKGLKWLVKASRGHGTDQQCLSNKMVTVHLSQVHKQCFKSWTVLALVRQPRHEDTKTHTCAIIVGITSSNGIFTHSKTLCQRAPPFSNGHCNVLQDVEVVWGRDVNHGTG